MPGKASMSERGQSRHFDRAPLTSGLPEKQTFSVSVGMSQRCHWPPRGTAPASAHRADRQGIALAPTPRGQTVTVPSLWTSINLRCGVSGNFRYGSRPLAAILR